MGGKNGEMEPADGGEEQCDRRLVLVTPSPKPAVLKPEALRVCGKRNESESSSPGRDRPVSKISIRNARIRASPQLRVVLDRADASARARGRGERLGWRHGAVGADPYGRRAPFGWRFSALSR